MPLTLIWLGIGEGSKVALLWIGTFFQLVLLVADDARRVPKEFIETGLTLGANDRALMKDILFRAMLPNMVDSLRITLGWCWTYLIVAEIVASNSGIGYELWTARRYGKTPEVFAGILTIGVIGLVSDQAIRFAAPPLVPLPELSAAWPSDSFIEFRALTKVFFDERGRATPVVEPLSLTIAEGEFVVFVGPSGCGKTTVMRMVGGLETPTTGEVLLDGRPRRRRRAARRAWCSSPTRPSRG